MFETKVENIEVNNSFPLCRLFFYPIGRLFYMNVSVHFYVFTLVFIEEAK